MDCLWLWYNKSGVKGLPIPEVSKDKIIEALHNFDKDMRESWEWKAWESRRNHKYALKYDGKLYPVKESIRLATGFSDFSGGKQANEYLTKLGFEIVKLREDEDIDFEFEDSDLVKGISGTRWRKRLAPILGTRLESLTERRTKVYIVPRRPQIYIFDMEFQDKIHNYLAYPKFHFDLWGDQGKYHYGIYIEKGLQEHKDPNMVMTRDWSWHKLIDHLRKKSFFDEFLDILTRNDLEIACELDNPETTIVFKPTGEGMKKAEGSKNAWEEVKSEDFLNFIFNIPGDRWCNLYIRKVQNIGPDRRISIQPIIETYGELAPIIYSILPSNIEQRSFHKGGGDSADLGHLLAEKKQVIFYGPPGTGKTYAAERLARDFVHDDRSLFHVTFHPAFGYEEFVEGITVNTEESNETIGYCLREGIFKKACKHALGIALGYHPEDLEGLTWNQVFQEYRKRSESGSPSDFKKNVVMVIDEINRGDIAKIFGELVTLLEADKRLGEENEITVSLPYSNDTFGVPPNLYIIGTMNTADVSIALVDIALRRRFAFCEMMPDLDEDGALLALHRKKGTYDLVRPSVEALRVINDRISRERSLGRDKQIGHSFLFEVEDKHDLYRVWRYEILPLLEEYFYGDYPHINEILFGDRERTDCMDPVRGIVLTPEGLEGMINGILESSRGR